MDAFRCQSCRRSARRAGTPHVTVGRAGQHAAAIELLEERHHVLAARPGGVAEGGRRERAGRRQPERDRLQAGERRGGPREVLVDADDPSRTPRGRSPRPAGSRRRGPLRARLRRRGRVEGGLEAIHRGEHRRGEADGPLGQVHEVASPGQPPGADERLDERARRLAGDGRVHRRPPAQRPPETGAQLGERDPASGAAAHGRERLRDHRGRDRRGEHEPAGRDPAARRESPDLGPRPRQRPVERRAAAAARSAEEEAVARARTSTAVARRHAAPVGGRGSSTRPPASGSAGDGRRSTNRSPGAAAIGAASRRIAVAAAVRQVVDVAPRAPHDALDLGRPEVHPDRSSGRPAGFAAPRPGRGPAPAAGAPAGGRWRRRPGRRPGRRRAPARLAPRPARLSGEPPARSAELDGAPAHLQLAGANDRPAGLQPERRAARHGPTPERAGDDGATALHAEDAVDRQASRAGRPGAVGPGAVPQVDERRRRALQRRRRSPPRPRRPARRRGVVGARRPRPRPRPPAPAPPSTASAFVIATTAWRRPSASSSSRCSRVWARGPSSAATTSSTASISPAPTSMLPTSRSWPGDVDEVEHVAVGQREVGVADVDRHPAPPLLGEAVGVDPGQRPEQRRLAVVDVARGPDDDGHRRRRAPRATAAARSSSAAGSTVRRSSTTRPSSIRPMTAGSPVRRAAEEPVGRARGERQPEGRQRLARQRPAADGRPSARRPAPRRVARRRGRRPRVRRVVGRRARSSARPGSRRSARPARYRPSVAATPARVALSGRIARASGSLRSRATRSARPTISPACGPPTSLSPLKVTRSAPAARRSRGVGSWASPKAAVSSSAPLPRSSTTSAP